MCVLENAIGIKEDVFFGQEILTDFGELGKALNV